MELVYQKVGLKKFQFVLFVVLNILDLILTIIALNLGASELNPIMRLGNLLTIKLFLVPALVLFMLLRFNKTYLLKYINIGLGLIVVYNAIIVVIGLVIISAVQRVL